MSTVYTVVHESSMHFDSTEVVGCVCVCVHVCACSHIKSVLVGSQG